MAGHVHDCPGGCGRQMLQPDRPCNDCQLRLPGRIRARLSAATPLRRTEPAQYLDAIAAVLAWFRNNPREVAGHGC